MTRLILQPCGDSDAAEHFVDTIEHPVNIDRVRKYLSDDQLDLLGPVFRNRTKIAVWGVTPGKNDINVNKWEKIQKGDIALFSRKGKIFASSTVAEKIHNRDLALELWKTNSVGNTWEYVYFLDEIRNEDIPYTRFNAAMGYADNYVIQGFNVISEERSDRAMASLDLYSERYLPDIAETEFRDAISFPDELTETDREIKAKSRMEQWFLRKHLFGNNLISDCCICGDTFPVDLLCTSHIKKRSNCSHTERLDFANVVAPMCLNGCDSLFEKGYILVDQHGNIIRGRTEVVVNGLEKKLESVLGRKCSAWREQSEKYFGWHRSRFIP